MYFRLPEVITMTGSRTLLGRDRERRLIGGLIATADTHGAGAPGTALLLAGEPGIGRSALLGHAAGAAAASGATVAWTRGVEGETALPFAALADALLPFREHLPGLPPAQRAALEAALALSAGPAPDAYAVCAGTLGLLTLAAGADPIVLLADDLQWIDPGSRRALLFAARRTAGTRVTMLLAVRTRPGELAADPDPPPGPPPRLPTARLPTAGLPTVEVRPLGAADCAELLRRHGHQVSPGVAAELAWWCGGNPLALLESAASLGPGRLADAENVTRAVPSAGPVLERAWLPHIDGLPGPARQALAIVAAGRTSSVTFATSALAAAGLSPAALAPAERSGLLVVTDAGCELPHPVLRSVVMRRLPLADRRHVFRVLAGVSSGTARERYLAAAAGDPDENAARSLVAAALEERRTGAPNAAARTGRRAAGATADREARADRLLQAASDAFLGGSPAAAATWCDEALTAAVDPPRRADIEVLRGRVHAWSGLLDAAGERLVTAAHAVRNVDPLRAAALFAEAALAAIMDGQIAPALRRAADGRDVAADAAVMSMPGSVVYGSVLIIAGRVAEGRDVLDKWADALAAADPVRDGQLLTTAAQARCWAGDDAECGRLLSWVIDAARRHGAPAALPMALAAHADLDLRRGRWAAAYAGAAEALRWAGTLRHPGAAGHALGCLARLDAYRGDHARCEERVARARREAGPFAIGCLDVRLTAVLGAAALTRGECDTAVAHLESAFERAGSDGLGNPIVVPFLADLAEAHIRAGNAGRATEVVGHLEERARATGLAWPRAAAARARMLLAETAADADAWFDVAGPACRRRDMPFEHARTLLCRGEVLRRTRRPAAARAPLLAAQAAFESLGALPWAKRTGTELGATRQSPVVRTRVGAVEELTTQELQVARTIAEGMSNDEAAGALFVSRKTIEAHLTRVYRKLAIRSRTELTRALISAGLAE
jgi:DNA-binding CsgD family transcriptional regulator